jgi:Flp pilus assembly pilin Flp
MSTSQADRPSHEQQGVSSIEYALLGSLIAAFCVSMVAAFGTEMAGLYKVICTGVAV